MKASATLTAEYGAKINTDNIAQQGPEAVAACLEWVKEIKLATNREETDLLESARAGAACARAAFQGVQVFGLE